jgi:hypothetical protein
MDTTFDPEHALARYIELSNIHEEECMRDNPLTDFNCSDTHLALLDLYLEAERNGYFLYSDDGGYDDLTGKHKVIFGYRDCPLRDRWEEYLHKERADRLQARRRLEFARWLAQQRRIEP